MSKKYIYNAVEFNEGDKVMVTRQADDFEENGMGDGIDWCEPWIDGEVVDQPVECADGNIVMVKAYDPGMDRFLLETFTIGSISEEGVTFAESDTNPDTYPPYAFPLCCLENITAKMKEAA